MNFNLSSEKFKINKSWEKIIIPKKIWLINPKRLTNCNKKIITLHEITDKIISSLKDIYEKFPENVFLIIFSEVLEKKSKLRNFFEKENNTICIPCYLDNEKDLQIIASLELKKLSNFVFYCISIKPNLVFLCTSI